MEKKFPDQFFFLPNNEKRPYCFQSPLIDAPLCPITLNFKPDSKSNMTCIFSHTLLKL